MLIIPVTLLACTTRPGGLTAAKSRAVESSLPGIPVPAGSLPQGSFDGGGGVVMAFYSHPQLQVAEVLSFYETQMPAWGWTAIAPAEPQLRERTFEREGVPVLIGVEEEGAGSRISILRGARGDWGFMPQMRKPE